MRGTIAGVVVLLVGRLGKRAGARIVKVARQLRARPPSRGLTGRQKLAAFDAVRHYVNPHTRTTVAFASRAQRREALKLVGLLNGVGWPAVLRETPLGAGTRPEPFPGIQVRGWNGGLVVAMAIALGRAGVMGVEPRILTGAFGPDHPERHLQHNIVDVWVGVQETRGSGAWNVKPVVWVLATSGLPSSCYLPS